jgi:6-phosphogluconolactonase
MTTFSTRRFPSRSALEAALSERLARAIAVRGRSAVMLAGGTTPLPAYRALASRELPHDAALHILFSDDRYVPCDSPASNYHQTRALLDTLQLPPQQVLRVRTELPLEQAAADYDRSLTALLAAVGSIGLGLLGLGAEGHTASLFPDTDLERARGRLAIAVRRPDGMSAVSVTPELIARVTEPLFVVAGHAKHDAVEAFIAQDASLPAWRAVQGCAGVELWTAELD